MTSFAGLPFHPLLVHVVVVLLPLAALAFPFVVFLRKIRRPFDVVVLAGLVIGTVFAFAAKISGEGLAEIVGNPVSHATWGNILPWFALLLTIVAAIWTWLERKQSDPNAKSAANTVLGVLGSLLALVVILLSLVVGHSGAEAVWAGTIKAGGGASSSNSTASPSASADASAQQIVFADVKKHDTQKDCWTAINGTVYNLTDWIAQHPGGAQSIIDLCGTDGSAAFDAQHGGQGKPERELKGFAIGALITDNATAAPSASSSTGAATLSMAEVKKHNSAKDCWSAVAGNVYNLTDWIAQHPGGSGAIEGMCGIDATDAFNAQHGGQGRPERELGNFLLGPPG